MIQRDSLHRVYSCAQCAKSILTRARAFLSMQVPSFPQARLHGRGLSSVATAGTRRTPWKGSDRVELEWLERKSQNQSYSFVFFISFFCSNFQVFHLLVLMEIGKVGLPKQTVVYYVKLHRWNNACEGCS